MRRVWNEQDITKALKKMGKLSVNPEVFERAWFKIEERIAAKGKHFWTPIIWKPWSHPVRWVAATACLCIAFTAFLYQRNMIDQTEMESYVISVSNPTENVTKDLGIVRVSRLLSEPSASVADLMIDDVHVDPLPEDQILL
jgi:hypothetical protein